MFQAARAGELPTETTNLPGGIRLPPGRRVSADPGFASNADAAQTAVLWVSHEHVGELTAQMETLVETFPRTGLWPIALESLHSDDTRPWLDGEFDPGGSSDPAAHDVEAVLREWWGNALPAEDSRDKLSPETLAPFTRDFPGLAISESSGPARSLNLTAIHLSARLGIVAVTRPADVPAVVGWAGPVNHYSDMGMLSAVLRSWEERFGAYVIGMGFDTLQLRVTRPPSTHSVALALAAEHFAACPDSIYQGAFTLDRYAASLVDETTWLFWWD